MVARKFIGLVLFAFASCVLTQQSKASSAIAGSSFEVGTFSTLPTQIGKYPTKSYPGYPNFIEGWTVQNYAFQFGQITELVGTSTQIPRGYAFKSNNGWITVGQPTDGNYYALLMTGANSQSGNQVNSITTSEKVFIVANEDVQFDMFLYTENNDVNNPADASFSVSLTSDAAGLNPAVVLHSGNTQGMIVQPWTTVSYSVPETGWYYLNFSVQKMANNTNNVVTYFGVDNVRVVPVPAAAYAGLALLGLFPLRKKLMGR